MQAGVVVEGNGGNGGSSCSVGALDGGGGHHDLTPVDKRSHRPVQSNKCCQIEQNLHHHTTISSMKVHQHGGSDTDNESTAGDRLILEARQDFGRALALGAASVVFTLVAGMAADTILSGFAFHNMEVLALFQQV